MASYSWEKPLCLIENTGDHGLAINETALERLGEVKVPVVVVSIVGLYRTGKSYLLNLLAGQQSGFALGSTIQSKTKGIWAWCRPHPKKKDHCLLLLDTEGLGDVEKGDRNHDKWVFALSVLLSSTFVYNSMGTIDQDAIDNLHFVTEITDHIKVKASSDDEEGTDFEAFFPEFIWAIRDFTLELVWDGKKINSDQYLEQALTPKKGTNRKVFDYNLPRDCIRNYFPSRKCFTFPQPVNQRGLMRKLETLSKEEFDPDFITISEEFAQHVYNRTRPKRIEGHPINGSMLGNMAQCYVRAIQNGAVPCIQNAVEATSILENGKAVTHSLGVYRAHMLDTLKLPTDSLDQMSSVHTASEKQAIATFLKMAIFDQDQQYQKKMMAAVQDEYKALIKRNEEASRDVCTQLLDELYGVVTKGLQSEVYVRPGGYEQYKLDMKQLEDRYNTTPGRGIMAKEVLRHFLSTKEAEGKALLAADQKLTAEQKRAEEEGRKAEEYQRQMKAAEEAKKRTEQLAADQKKSHEENVKQLQQKMEDDRRALKEETGAMLQKKLKEQEELLKEGYKQQADEMKDQIARLKERQAASSQSGGGLFKLIGQAMDGVLGLLKPKLPLP